jgi:hypothetical protein
MRKDLLLLAILSFLAFGCGKNSEDDQTRDAVTEANIHLSIGECNKAIEILENNGRKPNNADYLKTLASAYACRANYSTIRFFNDDLPKIGNANTILGGTTLFSTSSSMTASTSSSYLDLKEAIDILLYAGGIAKTTNPTAVKRAAKFSGDELDEINSFLTYLLMANLGQYLKFYGNASSSGEKGAGSAANTCFANYDDIAVEHPTLGNTTLSAVLSAGVTGSCQALGTGSSHLGATGSLNIPRMCEGVVTLNNVIEVLPVFLANFEGNDFQEFEDIIADIETIKNEFVSTNPTMATIVNTLSYDKCVSDNQANSDAIQLYFGLILEALFL